MGKENTYTKEEMYEMYPYLGVLESAVRTLPDEATIVELGAWSGKATSAMYIGAKDGHDIIAVDHFGGSSNAIEVKRFDDMRKQVANAGYSGPKELFLESIENVAKSGLGNGRVYLFEEDFDTAAHDFPAESIDMIFLDGDHMQAMHDLLVWVPRVKRGGKVFVHDVDCPHFTVAEEFQVFCEFYGFDWDMDGSLGCFTK
jgi:predicted O-methyltransferase YrrM